MNKSDERERRMDSKKMCVSVCMFAGSTTNTRLQYLSQENKNSQAWTQTMITSPDMHVRQLMLLPSLARELTTTLFFKGLTAGLFTQRTIGSLNLPQLKQKCI